MSRGRFSPAQLIALYEELDRECAEYAREHGEVTAALRNQIAASLMEAARNNPPAVALSVIGPHGT
jgi:hypothetical protein